MTSAAASAIPANGIANSLAEFAANLHYEDIPESVRTRAKHLVLDSVGIAHASGTYHFASVAMAAAQALSESGDSPVIGSSKKLSLRDAALVNGILCHGLDFDDTHSAGVIHATTSTFPCALATAGHVNASGKDMLIAYIIGVEAAARLGMVVKGGLHQIGFHPTGVMGSFGCSLVAGRLLGLNEKQLTMAQGIVLSMAAGSLEFLEDGAWTKRMHPGWAAVSGITAAFLAKEGYVGASRPYEGRFGLFNAYLSHPEYNAASDLSLATAGLRETWEIENVAIKPFPACHFTHGCIDAALGLIRENEIRADDIKRVRALVPQEVVKTVCEPVTNKRRPQNEYDAEFSIPFLVSAAITRGKFTLAELTDDSLQDPEILSLADRVDYEIDHDSGFPKYYSGEVVVEMNDGSEIRQREAINRGNSDRPISNEEIIEKFVGNIEIANGATDRVRDAILSMDTANNARDVAGQISS
ncbi:MAG TPA: MmgE/PrpD family protein [Gammaproteobacteria bacterium]|nr:MmgE/PrpD family protein [Gammaproteobacteria bacterium]